MKKGKQHSHVEHRLLYSLSHSCSDRRWLYPGLFLPCQDPGSWEHIAGGRQEACTKYFDKGHLGGAQIKSFLEQRPVQTENQCVSPQVPTAVTVPTHDHHPPAKEEGLSSQP